LPLYLPGNLVPTYQNTGSSDSPNICRVKVGGAGAGGEPGGGADEGGQPAHRAIWNRWYLCILDKFYQFINKVPHTISSCLLRSWQTLRRVSVVKSEMWDQAEQNVCVPYSPYFPTNRVYWSHYEDILPAASKHSLLLRDFKHILHRGCKQ
jgi:hypothetical protein